MIDEEYPYIDNRSVPSYVSPTKGQKSSINSQPLSIRNDFNQEENISHTNSHDNLLKGRSKFEYFHLFNKILFCFSNLVIVFIMNHLKVIPKIIYQEILHLNILIQ
jgi:hypothetical protein